MPMWVPLLIAYLIGSISFSYLVTRKVIGADIRQLGSGNAGATNTFRTVGKWPGVVVFLLDVFKGFAAVKVSHYFSPNSSIDAILCGLMAVIGHNWPFYLKFRGGKGIATTAGVSITLFFPVALMSGIIAIAAIFATRYISVGSLVFVGCLPILLTAFSYPLSYIFISLLILLLALIRHHTNISNLIKGKERTFALRERKHG